MAKKEKDLRLRKQKAKDKEKKKEMMTDFEREIEEKKKGNLEFSYPEKMVVGGVKYIREDHAVKYANSIPEEVTEKFLIKRTKGKWYNPFSWFGEKEEEFKPKGNLLFLMDNEGNLRIYDKVQSGYFRIKDDYSRADEGDLNAKYLILKPNKLRTITFETEEGDEEYWKCWVADVNNVNALPDTPKYDCEDVSELVNRAVAGNRAFAKKDSEWSWGWVKWVGGALIVAYLIYTAITKNLFGLGDMVGYAKPIIEEGAKAVATNVTSGNIPGGTLQ